MYKQKMELLAEKREALQALNQKGITENRSLTAEEGAQFDALEAEIRALVVETNRLKIAQDNEAIIAGRQGVQLGVENQRDESKKDKKDVAGYSFLRAIQTRLDPVNPKQLDGVEKEMHEEAQNEARACGQTITGIGVSSKVMKARNMEKRDNSITMSTQPEDGSALLETQKIISMDDMLRNSLVLAKLGATYREDLIGPIDYVRLSERPVATWKPEVGNLDKSNIKFTALSMAPKRLGTYTVHSKQFLMQTAASVEADIRSELAYSIAEGIDTGGLFGLGTGGEPTGLYTVLNALAAQSIALGPDANNGAALTRSNLIAAITKLLAANVTGRNLGWLFNALTMGKLMDTAVGSDGDKFLMESLTSLLNFPAELTNSVLNTYAKGTSGNINTIAFFGAWENLKINKYGGYDLLVDPYTLGQAGQVRLIIQAFADVLVYEPKAFVLLKNVKNV